MSIEAVAWALRQRRVNTPALRLVLIALADYARPDGSAAFASVEALQQITGMEESSIRAALERLELSGAVRRCRPPILSTLAGRRLPVGYTLDMREEPSPELLSAARMGGGSPGLSVINGGRK